MTAHSISLALFGLLVPIVLEPASGREIPVQLPFDAGCPVLHNKDDHRDVYTDELLLALSHLGGIDLRGVVTTYAANDREYDEFVSGRTRIAAMARESGLRNVSEPVHGTNRRLEHPATNRIEDTRPLGLEAADRIIADARAASRGCTRSTITRMARLPPAVCPFTPFPDS